MSVFQTGVALWLDDCFGPMVAGDCEERSQRFIEEALELVQACGMSREDVLTLVDYTYNRPLGVKFQEVGGVMVTLAALCQAQGLDLEGCAQTELDRVHTVIEEIRAKQATKPHASPLPGKSV